MRSLFIFKIYYEKIDDLKFNDKSLKKISQDFIENISINQKV